MFLCKLKRLQCIFTGKLFVNKGKYLEKIQKLQKIKVVPAIKGAEHKKWQKKKKH